MAGEQCTLSNDGLQHITLNNQGMRTSSSGPAQATLDVFQGQVGVGTAVLADHDRAAMYRSILPAQRQGNGVLLNEQQFQMLQHVYYNANLSNEALAAVGLSAARLIEIVATRRPPDVDIAISRAVRVACECPQEYLGQLEEAPGMRQMLNGLQRLCPAKPQEQELEPDTRPMG